MKKSKIDYPSEHIDEIGPWRDWKKLPEASGLGSLHDELMRPLYEAAVSIIAVPIFRQYSSDLRHPKKRRPARRTGLQNTEQPHAHL
jgi:hypothetical protein